MRNPRSAPHRRSRFATIRNSRASRQFGRAGFVAARGECPEGPPPVHTTARSPGTLRASPRWQIALETMHAPSVVGGDGEAHWDAAYRDRGPLGVSWHQPTPSFSVELVRRLGIPKDGAVIDVGGGTSFLVDVLLAEGFSDLSVLDISGVALEVARRRLGPASPVTFIHEDLLMWTPSRRFALWHDRTVFHFFVDQTCRARYLDTMCEAVARTRWCRHPGHVRTRRARVLLGPSRCPLFGCGAVGGHRDGLRGRRAVERKARHAGGDGAAVHLGRRSSAPTGTRTIQLRLSVQECGWVRARA